MTNPKPPIVPLHQKLPISPGGKNSTSHKLPTSGAAPHLAETKLIHNELTYEYPWLRPFYPNFIDMFCQGDGVYEGITLIPALFSNAKNHETFYKNLRKALVIIGCGILIYAPMAVLAYGSKIQEIILLNLEYGVA